MTHHHGHDDAGHHDGADHTHSELGRRAVLAGAGGLLMLAAAPGSAYASTTPIAAGSPARITPKSGAARASQLSQGTLLVHADLHNHTLMSDGDGNPDLAFQSMRDAGLDVAALTDHTTLFGISGLSKSEWDRTGVLAGAADDPGNYTAIRGFEWSHPTLGHVNVWGTASFTDLLATSSMSKLYNWVNGVDGVASFNHPGREVQRFNNFSLSSAAVDNKLRPGTTAPAVADVIDVAAGGVYTFTVPMNVADGNWVVLRVSDPAQANPSPGPAGHPCNDWGVAYSSPWWLQP